MFDSSISFNSRFFFYYCFYSFVLFFCEFKFGDFQIFALRCNFCRCRFDRLFLFCSFVSLLLLLCFFLSFLSSPFQAIFLDTRSSVAMRLRHYCNISNTRALHRQRNRSGLPGFGGLRTPRDYVPFYRGGVAQSYTDPFVALRLYTWKHSRNFYEVK